VSAEAAVAIRALSDRFADSQDMDEIARFTGLPVLAALPRGSEADAIEAFRILRTSLLSVPLADRPRTVAVVSSQPGEGKSFTAINLARAAAQLDSEVVLVDADLRRPVVHVRLELPREPGLSDVLAGADPESVMRRVVEGEIRFRVRESGAPLSERPTQYRVITSGAAVADPSSALSGRAFPRMLDTLDQPQNLVVVDTPPASMFADGLTVAAACDVTVLVLDVHASRTRVVKRTIQSFQQVGAHLAGVVVNRVDVPKTSYYAGRK
jgi:capsular exopolysaccharide synthesis family protein